LSQVLPGGLGGFFVSPFLRIIESIKMLDYTASNVIKWPRWNDGFLIHTSVAAHLARISICFGSLCFPFRPLQGIPISNINFGEKYELACQVNVKHVDITRREIQFFKIRSEKNSKLSRTLTDCRHGIKCADSVHQLFISKFPNCSVTIEFFRVEKNHRPLSGNFHQLKAPSQG
jgi:hypothetical protein